VAVLAVLPAYAQAKNEGIQKTSENRRTFPLSKFYDTANPLPPEKPGSLIRSQEFDDYDLPPSVLAVRILYHSRSATGQDIAASGVVLYPEAKPPAGGWPVIAWAHPLNDVARQCAPSLARNLQYGTILSMYVNLGYAVVATDYAGLGTSSRNAFSDVPSDASDVAYSVPAARAAVPQLGSRWIAIGIGEGGPVVVGVDELERQIGDANYLGSVAIAALYDSPDLYNQSGSHSSSAFPLFLAYGIKTVFPQFEVKEILTEKGLALYSQVEQRCSESLQVSPAEVLKAHWESSPFVTQYFDRNTIGRATAESPLLIIRGDLDASLPIQGTAQVISRMCKQGDRVQFETYPQSDASHVFGDSVSDQLSWIRARFAGRAAPNNCAGGR
jgi:pimeloyl-ACP methyl ester carboxylesterase